MTHKFIEIKKARKTIMPYLNTTVSFDKSFSEIQALLIKFGCEDLLTRTQPGIVPKLNIPCTFYSIGFIQKGTKFLIEFPITIVLTGRYSGNKAVNMNISGRIIYNKVKAMLVDVEIDYLTFQQAMLPYMMLQSPDGRSVPLADFIDENRQQLQSGVGQFFALGNGRSD
ncbi:MAG: hypothetical protein MUO73_05615 [Thermoplasmata archaeon]|nr:hypothetical protein [Thermoplasmata archaeon]